MEVEALAVDIHRHIRMVDDPLGHTAPVPAETLMLPAVIRNLFVP